MEHRIDKLISLVRQLFIGQHVTPATTLEPARVCGICGYASHPTDACPQQQEDTLVLQDHIIPATGVFLGKP